MKTIAYIVGFYIGYRVVDELVYHAEKKLSAK